MMLAELERTEALQEEKEQFCHILCECNEYVTLCGAYKPSLCGEMAIDAFRGITHCPVCKLLVCTDCLSLVFDECPRCGL